MAQRTRRDVPAQAPLMPFIVVVLGILCLYLKYKGWL